MSTVKAGGQSFPLPSDLLIDTLWSIINDGNSFFPLQCTHFIVCHSAQQGCMTVYCSIYQPVTHMQPFKVLLATSKSFYQLYFFSNCTIKKWPWNLMEQLLSSINFQSLHQYCTYHHRYTDCILLVENQALRDRTCHLPHKPRLRKWVHQHHGHGCFSRLAQGTLLPLFLL